MDEQSLTTKRRLKRLEALAAGAGGGGGSLAPLSRLKFIDGGTTQTGNTGSIGAPYSTIAKWTAALGAPTSGADATQPVVGYLTPSVNGYTEDTAYPGGRNVLLMTDPAAPITGTVTGNATWANTALANAPLLAICEERNIERIGNFTVTDDGTSNSAIVIIACTNLGAGSGVSGTFTSTGATHLVDLVLFNALMGPINCGSAASSAQIAAVGSQFNSGTVTALAVSALSTQINCTAITVHTSSAFWNCEFGNAVTLTTGTGTANTNLFDGPSWRSFLGAGGTRASGVIVVVHGGFYAGPVYGAALPTGAGPTNVSFDGTGATAGFTGSNSGNVYVSSGLTADSTVNVLTSQATGGGDSAGDTLCITKTDLAAHTLTVKNNGGTTIGVIPSGSRGSIVLVRAAGTAIGGITNDWALSNCGSLAA